MGLTQTIQLLEQLLQMYDISSKTFNKYELKPNLPLTLLKTSFVNLPSYSLGWAYSYWIVLVRTIINKTIAR
jgi:hypothetical protein